MRIALLILLAFALAGCSNVSEFANGYDRELQLKYEDPDSGTSATYSIKRNRK